MELTKELKEKIDNYFNNIQKDNLEYQFQKSIELNKKFVGTKSNIELDLIMSEFDKYETE